MKNKRILVYLSVLATLSISSCSIFSKASSPESMQESIFSNLISSKNDETSSKDNTSSVSNEKS